MRHLGSLVILAICATPAAAQSVCFESGNSVVTGFVSWKASADIDGDHDVDLAWLEGLAYYVSRNLGNATFAPKELLGQEANGSVSSLFASDFDGDLDTDLVALHTTNPGGGGFNWGFPVIWGNNGTGGFSWTPLPTQGFTDAFGMLCTDFDGDGDPDLLVLKWGTLHILRNDGSLVFVQVDSSNGALAAPAGVAVGDFDGDLDADVVWKSSSGGLFTLQNDGSNHFSILAPTTGGVPVLLADLDGDGDRDLVTRVSTTTTAYAVSLNNGSGTFGAETIIPGYSQPLTSQLEVTEGDLDADGDLDLAVTSTAAPRLTVLRNFGNATFDVSSDVATDTSNPLRGPLSGDLDADGDADLLVTENGTAWGVRRYRGCSTAIEPLCFGDGSGTACPCGNDSLPGAQAGCLNSLVSAGTLRGAGSARLANDTLELSGSGMPNSTALYFQGTALAAGGNGILLGDGLRCGGGALIRLGVRTNVGGASVFPGPGSPSLSVLGQVTVPGERIYQTWYRDTASFCSAQDYNLTNGLRVLWGP